MRSKISAITFAALSIKTSRMIGGGDGRDNNGHEYISEMYDEEIV